jgi:pyrimidine-nucleoside phosphorylase
MLGVELSVGRRTLDSKIDYSAGFLFKKKVGDRVASGEAIAEVVGADEGKVKEVSAVLPSLIAISRAVPRSKRMVLARLDAQTGVGSRAW